MIRVTLEIIPSTGAKKFTAGVLEIANDTTGNRAIGNYDLEIHGPVHDGDQVLNNDFWSKERLEGFDRNRGWWSCVKEALNKLETDWESLQLDYERGPK